MFLASPFGFVCELIVHHCILVGPKELVLELSHHVPRAIRRPSRSEVHHVPRTITFRGPSRSEDHHVPRAITLRGPSRSEDHHVPRTITFRGSSRSEDNHVPFHVHHVPRTITFRGPLRSEDHHAPFHVHHVPRTITVRGRGSSWESRRWTKAATTNSEVRPDIKLRISATERRMLLASASDCFPPPGGGDLSAAVSGRLFTPGGTFRCRFGATVYARGNFRLPFRGGCLRPGDLSAAVSGRLFKRAGRDACRIQLRSRARHGDTHARNGGRPAPPQNVHPNHGGAACRVIK